MIVAIRLRGGIKMNREIKETLRLLGLKRVNTLVVLPEKKEIIGMLQKVESYITWGELPEGMNIEKTMRLKPPRGGLKSIKRKYPKGDLGYRGDKISDLIKKMM